MIWAAALAFSVASAGGLQWTAPQAWKDAGVKPMRAATYSVAPAAGDKEAAECAVFYFGAGQGGGVDANLKRWAGQFKQPDGTPSEKKARTSKRTANGMQVTVIDLTGTYVGGTASKPAYRMLGAIVEGPQGAVFFKFVGPAKTIASNEGAFKALVDSVKK